MNNVIATPVFVKEFKVRSWKVRMTWAWNTKTKVAVLIALSIFLLAIPRMVS
jgi:hypothetical protein